MNRLSVIIPLYNAEKYIRKTIKSIISQTYTDIQIILVDDGSTDDSLRICREYAENDKRITIIHKENGGLVSARKAGLEAATGEFIGFVDSDDWIEPEYYENLIREQNKYDADVVAGNLYFDIGNNSTIVRNNIDTGLYRTNDILKNVLYSGNFFEYGIQLHLVTKLIRKNILEKALPFVDNKIIVGEDAATFYSCILYASSIYVSDVCGYHYIQHPSSITKTKLSNEKERIDLLINYIKKVYLSENKYEIILPQLIQFKKYLYILRNIGFLKEEGIELYDDITRDNRLVIYCAGGVGQEAYRYFNSRNYNIVLWVDSNFSYYDKYGLNVKKPSLIMEYDYDYILIAVISQNTFLSIKKSLTDMHIPESKIKWFSKKILDENFPVNL